MGEKWRDEKLAEQEATPLSEMPKLTVSMINSKIGDLESEVQFLIRKAKMKKAELERESAPPTEAPPTEDGEPVPSEEKPESKTDGAEEPEVGKEEGESVDSKEHAE